MKTKKLNLDELKVKSFVTNVKTDLLNTAKGGNASEEYTVCCWEDELTQYRSYCGTCVC